MAESPILVLTGSARVLRRAPAVASWVANIGRQTSERCFEVVDVATLGLTLSDEAAMPALGRYERVTTQNWSDKVLASAGLIVVTPQYNWGYPAPLKNALDHLYSEWKGKPASIITFGGHGGGKCGAQLRQVMEGALEMRLTVTQPELTLPRDLIRADDGEVDAEATFVDRHSEIQTAVRELMALISLT